MLQIAVFFISKMDIKNNLFFSGFAFSLHFHIFQPELTGLFLFLMNSVLYLMKIKKLS